MDIPHILIVESPYYTEIADGLAAGAIAVLEAAGVTHERISVPGAFELPAAIRFAVRSMNFMTTTRKRFHGFIALGCVIRGETSHYDLICQETARALQDLAVQYTLALGFGVLTTETYEQALERALPSGQDKGGEAARACMRMVELKRHFQLYPR